MKDKTKFKYSIDDTPCVADIHQIKSQLQIELVSRTELEPLWDQLVSDYHYLGHGKTIGPRVKYIIWLDGRPVSAISFNQAAYKLGVRDECINWNQEEKKKNLAHVLNNNRFLILPWVTIKNLASHILSLSIRRLKVDWFHMYKKEPYLLETFVDQEKYRGTCYKAANWNYVGESGGFEKIGKTYVYHGNKKAVYLYVIEKDFKKIIGITEKPPRVLQINQPLEMAYMQLQQNDWHPQLLEEAKIKDAAEQLPQMLKSHMERFHECFQRSEQEFNGNIYVQGLLSNLERKSIEPIALEFNADKRGVRNLQFFMKDAKWNHEKALMIYQQGLAQKIAVPEGMLTIDESGVAKKGNQSVGVARQYCGSVGKVENAQVGVYLGYANPSGGYGLISSQLFMPEKWFTDDYKKRRTECLVPEKLAFQTKPEIAMKLLQDIEQLGVFPAKWVGVDSLYGNSKTFLNAIPEQYWYFADIHNDALVWRSQPTFEIPPYNGRGRKPTRAMPIIKPEPVSKLAEDVKIPWKNMYLGEGSKGAVYAQIKSIRVYRAFKMEDGSYETEACWLFIRRREDGETRFSVSNAPEDVKESELCKASLMRWPIEQCFNEMKDQLGMDHVEARSWTAWHRHMLLVFIAYEFLLEVRLLVTDQKKSPFYH